MRRATMSVLGLYNYNPEIFTRMYLPAGVERTGLVQNILMECAELEITYPDPDFFADALAAWSAIMAPTWDRQAKALAIDYNPLENYDRQEDWNDDRSGSATSSSRAFNTDTMTERDKTASTDKASHKGRIHGNIGVTTSQQMLREELDIAKETMYSIIINDFKRRFCLLVY